MEVWCESGVVVESGGGVEVEWWCWCEELGEVGGVGLEGWWGVGGAVVFEDGGEEAIDW